VKCVPSFRFSRAFSRTSCPNRYILEQCAKYPYIVQNIRTFPVLIYTFCFHILQHIQHPSQGQSQYFLSINQIRLNRKQKAAVKAGTEHPSCYPSLFFPNHNLFTLFEVLSDIIRAALPASRGFAYMAWHPPPKDETLYRKNAAVIAPAV
jgi:hypothetical protein